MNTFEIKNNQGDCIIITNYGARITKWLTNVAGETRNIVLGFDKLEDYLNDTSYLGAIVGPFANRIANAQCLINEQKIQLTANEGENVLHGGALSLSHQIWTCTEHIENSLTLSCTLPDGYNGFPGDIVVVVKYEISSSSGLSITLNVESEKLTIAGPTAHPYFNLNTGQQSFNHSLQISSDFYTPLTKSCIPDGEIAPVKGTKYDFTELKPTYQLKESHKCTSTSVKNIDNNFLISLTDTTDSQLTFHHATLVSEDEKLTLHASSNYPAIQVYTAEHLQPPFEPNQGVCLEPQFCPNSPNEEAFPFHLTGPNKPLNTIIVYQLEK